MVDLIKYTPSIDIRLTEPGIYVFPNVATSGKSLLCRQFRDLSPYEPVNSLTFVDLSIVDIKKLFNISKFSVILLDRYDMYCGQFLDEIQEFSKSGIVLVDCKSYRFPFTVSSCGIYLCDDKIIVM